jgi:hypothetical protein
MSAARFSIQREDTEAWSVTPTKKNVKHWRPAPGMFPPANGKSASNFEDTAMPWNDRWNAKKICEHNLEAARGMNTRKLFFSRPQSEPELRRFYATFSGYEEMARRYDEAEGIKAGSKVRLRCMPGAFAHLESKRGVVKGWDATKHKWLVHTYDGIAAHVPAECLEIHWVTKRQPGPALSTLSFEDVNRPGNSRHLPGGTMKDKAGKVTHWQELTPRALKKVIIDPGTNDFRSPPRPLPKFLFTGRDAKPGELHYGKF